MFTLNKGVTTHATREWRLRADAQETCINIACYGWMTTGYEDAHDLANWQGGANRPDAQARRVHWHDQVCVCKCVLG
jgi:hypothetical protein